MWVAWKGGNQLKPYRVKVNKCLHGPVVKIVAGAGGCFVVEKHTLSNRRGYGDSVYFLNFGAEEPPPPFTAMRWPLT